MDIKMLYLLVIVFSLCLLKPVEASDLPAPPFKKLWACSVGEQAGPPTFCDSVICFDTWPSLKAIVFGAVDLKTGKILWKKTIEGHHIIEETYENKRLYMVIEKDGADDIRKLTYTGSGEVLVLKPDSGVELSRIPIDGVGCDPIIKDTTLYCVFGDNVLKSIAPDTYKTIWTTMISDVSENVEFLSSSTIINRKQLKVIGTYLFILDNNRIVCVNRQTGEVYWRYENAYWGISGDDKGEHIYIDFEKELSSLNGMNGRREWTVSMESDILRTPVSHRGLIFIVCRDGMLYALEADSGKVSWKCHLLKGEFARFSQPVIQENTIIVSADCKLFTVDLAGKILWEFDLQDSSFLDSGIRDIVVLEDGYLLSSFRSIFRYATEKQP
ncbi:MAG: PQQ-binding-like beta-propeller repeat protein [Vulcanimicrobiota bacterium]